MSEQDDARRQARRRFLAGLAAAGVVVALVGARAGLAGAGVLTVLAGAGTWLLARPALLAGAPRR